MSTTPPSGPVAVHAGKYLTVGLGSEVYGIAALRVREIIRLQAITPVPGFRTSSKASSTCAAG